MGCVILTDMLRFECLGICAGEECVGVLEGLGRSMSRRLEGSAMGQSSGYLLCRTSLGIWHPDLREMQRVSVYRFPISIPSPQFL